ncbi:MAG: sn-glycerol-3-phosphate ABC transporter ATP-binding protein UgpC [Victivallaceae bacterium]|nr:sn-glycerol-3-phosphate ABC transporter ATP-binding protein UgpC [Victivallaceae bacterium]MDD3704257.1 sn-glycerol-3-phosphate ABC transporter ATP-binding protein UgpC [Victivallaceae bacterium]MDD4318530.1 sn-glycerol-3-phosphate ABC transporter ATP-binding protein UgpC [Victivallaceae bacterium]MDD5663052.1 sn-glycerol-3-phosphate ABC transporter ATP-binding protein UgpC [Victivallaceae bacterium]NLK82656.1 sn-glycerol-3-phosphate ABC transporter ATP-binding protein UgpC [Lentisphaerota b
MAEVILRNVSKTYPGNVKAVDSISLEIRNREFMVLVGPSGCGKSTTLRMIAGLEEISAGEIIINGRVINNIPPKDRDIAMVFQNYALYPHMNVYDNMAFGLKLRKYKKTEIKKRVEEAARILNIESYLDRRPKNLSGGQRQRVAVGRAIVRKPEAFLFDEPLSNLDAKMRVQMRTEISKLHTQLETTMIYVTHDQTEAMTMGDRICVMKDGRIFQVDSPVNIYDNPANVFVAGFIGTPPMNFFNGRIEARDGKIFFLEDSFSLELPDLWKDKLDPYNAKNVVFGIRPENISWERGLSDYEAEVTSLVEVIEPMGAETYMYMDTGFHPFIARVDAHHPFKVGEKISLFFDLSRAHVFDAKTEMIIV